MEEFSTLWSYQEGIDELKQKLLYTTLELESLRVESMEESRKNKENVKQLIQLIKIAYQERDEAKVQLQKLVNKLTSSTSPTKIFTNLPNFQTHPKANSTITESNSYSDTYNYNSYNSYSSSPVDSFFDPVSSPELSNNLVFPNKALVQDCSSGGTVSTTQMASPIVPKVDPDSMVVDELVKGKTLPQRGKFLQAVLEAGPLLQTLLVAGPLPRWRNPPPLQAVQIPPVSINGCDAEILMRKPMNSSMSCGSSQMVSKSMLNFGSGQFGSCVGNGQLISAGLDARSYVPTGKRQRFQ